MHVDFLWLRQARAMLWLWYLGFSLWRFLLLSVGSGCAGFSSCGVWA